MHKSNPGFRVFLVLWHLHVLWFCCLKIRVFHTIWPPNASQLLSAYASPGPAWPLLSSSEELTSGGSKSQAPGHVLQWQQQQEEKEKQGPSLSSSPAASCARLPLFRCSKGKSALSNTWDTSWRLRNERTSANVWIKGSFRNQILVGTSLAVQWLRLSTSIAGGAGLIPGQGTKIPHAARCGRKKKNHQIFVCTRTDLNFSCIVTEIELYTISRICIWFYTNALK